MQVLTSVLQKTCIKCRDLLNVGVNCNQSDLDNYYFICRKCRSKRRKTEREKRVKSPRIRPSEAFVPKCCSCGHPITPLHVKPCDTRNFRYWHFDCWHDKNPICGVHGSYHDVITRFTRSGKPCISNKFFPDPDSEEARSTIFRSNNIHIVGDSESTYSYRFTYLNLTKKETFDEWTPRFKLLMFWIVSEPDDKPRWLRNGMPLHELLIFDSQESATDFIDNEIIHTPSPLFRRKKAFLWFHFVHHDVRICFPPELLKERDLRLEENRKRPVEIVIKPIKKMPKSQSQSLEIRDTLSFYNFGLEKIADKMFGMSKFQFMHLNAIEKIKKEPLPKEKDKKFQGKISERERRILKHKRLFDNQSRVIWTKRCSLDVYITGKIVRQIMDEHFALGLSAPKLSRPSLCHYQFCRLMNDSRRYRKLLFWLDPIMYYNFLPRKKKKDPVQKQLKNARPTQGLMLHAMAGGRTETTRRVFAKKAILADFFSMYPSVYYRRPLPYRRRETIVSPTSDQIKQIRREAAEGKCLYTIHARFEVPKERFVGPFLYRPLLQDLGNDWYSRTNLRAMFPVGKFKSVVNSPELMDSKYWSMVKQVYQMDVYDCARYARNYAKLHLLNKAEAKRDKQPILEQNSKLNMNAEFGKWLESDREETMPLERYLRFITKRGKHRRYITKQHAERIRQHIIRKSRKLNTFPISSEEPNSTVIRYPYYIKDDWRVEILFYPYEIRVSLLSRSTKFRPVRFMAGSFVTSYARALLRKVMELCGEEYLSGDTDSGYVTPKGFRILKKEGLIISKKELNAKHINLSKLTGRMEKQWEGEFVAIKPKVYGKIGKNEVTPTYKWKGTNLDELQSQFPTIEDFADIIISDATRMEIGTEIIVPFGVSSIPFSKRESRLTVMKDSKRDWCSIRDSKGKIVEERSKPPLFTIKKEKSYRVCCYCKERNLVLPEKWTDHFEKLHIGELVPAEANQNA